jgi:hypothetical protein
MSVFHCPLALALLAKPIQVAMDIVAVDIAMVVAPTFSPLRHEWN